MEACRVLLAGPDPRVRARWTLALRARRIVACDSLAETELQLASDPSPAVLVWDSVPAGEFTLESLEAVRRSHPRLAAVVLERRAAKAPRRKVVDAGSLQFLDKPVRPETLADAVERAAGRAQAEAVAGTAPCAVDEAVFRHHLIEMERHHQAFENLPIATMVVDARRRVLALNSEARRLTRASGRHIGVKTCKEICRCRLHDDKCPLFRALQTGRPVHRAEIPTGTKKNRRILIERVTPYRDPSTGESLAVITLGDATRHLRRMDRLRVKADVDPLTRVASRARFEEFWRRIELSERRMKPAALLMIDVDGLKRINDTLGHEAGDRLLARLGKVLLGVTRDTDLVARIGGDEFAIYCPNTIQSEAKILTRRVLRAIVRDNAKRAKEPELRVSIGFASSISPDSRDLRAAADRSLLHAKQARQSEL